jgi:hypothetical protein
MARKFAPPANLPGKGPAEEVALKLWLSLLYGIIGHIYFTPQRSSKSPNHLNKKIPITKMDHLHYRLNFDLDKNFITA